MIAYCWQSGLIGFGPAMPKGTIEILRGQAKKATNMSDINELLTTLVRVTQHLNDALYTHIYDTENGEEIPADCTTTKVIEEAQKIIAKHTVRVIVKVEGGVVQGIAVDSSFVDAVVLDLDDLNDEEEGSEERARLKALQQEYEPMERVF
jgi:hypothetical protein